MSTCISRHGEYSSHEIGPDYVCTLCGVLDEDALIAELKRLRIDRFKVQLERDAMRPVVEAANAWRDSWTEAWETRLTPGPSPIRRLLAAVDAYRSATSEQSAAEDLAEAERRHAEATRPTDGRAYSWTGSHWDLIETGEGDAPEPDRPTTPDEAGAR